jgi:hypothetical protein
MSSRQFWLRMLRSPGAYFSRRLFRPGMPLSIFMLRGRKSTRVELIGNAYNLHRPSDIQGTYTAAQAGLSIAGGRNAARLTNSRAVVLEVRGRTVGFMFSLDLSGMWISLRR